MLGGVPGGDGEGACEGAANGSRQRLPKLFRAKTATDDDDAAATDDDTTTTTMMMMMGDG